MMSGDVPGEIAPGTIPSAVRLGLLRESGAHAIERQHSIGLELEQILRGRRPAPFAAVRP